MGLTWQQRNALAEQPCAQYLTVANATVPTPPDEFGPGFTADIGQWGTPADGMDSPIALMLSTIAADASIVTVISGLVNGLGFVTGALEKSTIDPLIDDHAANIQFGNTPINNLWHNAANWSPWPIAPKPTGPPPGPPGPKCPPGNRWQQVAPGKPPICIEDK